MDIDGVTIQEVRVGEEVAPEVDGDAEPYTFIIPEAPAPSVIQSYQHENLQCFQCFITFCSSKAKERHMKKSHREEYKQQLQECDTLFTCYVCDRTFASSQELTQHQGAHNKEDKPFKCPHCEQRFRTFSEVTAHRRQVCREKLCVCRECGETCRGPALLRSHREAHRRAESEARHTYRCEKCGRGFETEQQLLEHQENHAGDQHCNSGGAKRRGRPPKSYRPPGPPGEQPPAPPQPEGQEEEEEESKKGKRRKKKEEEGGSNDRPAEAVASSGAVEKPKQGARRGRPPKTQPQPAREEEEEEEDEAAAAGGEAGEEERAERPDPLPLPCSDCGKKFGTAALLRAHRRLHRERKAHACPGCDESFARPEQLAAHAARAHGAGRHACPDCGKSFGREGNLRAHRQTHGAAAAAGR
ncbi:DNA-binding protein REPIN1-like [Lepisosteus oculatus]|uniref:DNA-binding protein REPIN1-like n=1 Tax=Lepisosteus oculatus TaxID=7918 RepID=UPI0037190CF2